MRFLIKDARLTQWARPLPVKDEVVSWSLSARTDHVWPTHRLTAGDSVGVLDIIRKEKAMLFFTNQHLRFLYEMEITILSTYNYCFRWLLITVWITTFRLLESHIGPPSPKDILFLFGTQISAVFRRGTLTSRRQSAFSALLFPCRFCLQFSCYLPYVWSLW